MLLMIRSWWSLANINGYVFAYVCMKIRIMANEKYNQTPNLENEGIFGVILCLIVFYATAYEKKQQETTKWGICSLMREEDAKLYKYIEWPHAHSAEHIS